MKIVLASANPDKRVEMEELLEGLPVELASVADFPGAPEVVEDGETFERNAAKKASQIAVWTGLHAVADDSGLCVDILDGAPGVKSARFAGPHGTYRDICRKLLGYLRYVPDSNRMARFECHIAFSDPEGNILLTARGVCEGTITRQMRGGRGFGYDPVFLYPPAGKTFAQMLPAEKHAVSHRGMAIREFCEKLTDYLRGEQS